MNFIICTQFLLFHFAYIKICFHKYWYFHVVFLLCSHFRQQRWFSTAIIYSTITLLIYIIHRWQLNISYFILILLYNHLKMVLRFLIYPCNYQLMSKLIRFKCLRVFQRAVKIWKLLRWLQWQVTSACFGHIAIASCFCNCVYAWLFTSGADLAHTHSYHRWIFRF